MCQIELGTMQFLDIEWPTVSRLSKTVECRTREAARCLEEVALELREARGQAEHDVARDVAHVALLRLGRRAADLHVRRVDQVRELVKGDLAGRGEWCTC